MPKKCSYSILFYIARLSKAMSLSLLLIFTGLQVAQSLHTHNQVPLAIQHRSGNALQKYTASCPICDYLLHKQATPGTITPELELNFFSNAPVALAAKHHQLTRAALVLSWTNKGPPSPFRS